jgi:predicted permease
MGWIRRFVRGLGALFQKRKRDAEMEEELRFHVEMRTRANLAAGMKSADARHAALRRFGGVEQIKELCRDLRGVGWIETLGRDIRYGIRMLTRTPGFTAIAVLTLGLGLGANTTVFSFLDRVWLRALPVHRPHELVRLEFRVDSGGTDDCFNYPLYAQYRAQHDVLAGLAADAGELADLRFGGGTERLVAMAVSDNYFSVLGVKPVLGRTFSQEGAETTNPQSVAVISYGIWQRQFDGDPAVLGKTLRVNDQALTIVGVVPAAFTGTLVGTGPAVYVSLSTWASLNGFALSDRGRTWLHLFGRLQAGVKPEQAQAALRVLAQQIHAVEPVNTHTEVFVKDGSRGYNLWLQEGWWWVLALLQAPAVLLLLVACANVSSMVLARATTRQKEIAIRLAIGGTRVHLVRQLVVESALLAFLGGLSGALLAHWLSGALGGVLPVVSALNMPMGVDVRILVFALLVSLAIVILVGLAPALRVSRPNLVTALNEGAGMIQLARGRWSFRQLLVMAQVACSVIVLSFGGLWLRSLAKLQFLDPGFEVNRVLAVTADLPDRDPRKARLGKIMGELEERLAAFPGVEALSLSSDVPLADGGKTRTTAEQMDQFEMPPAQSLSMDLTSVSPGYFGTLGVPLLRGRDFTVRDVSGAPKVMIVNEVFARRYWPNLDPLGKHVTFYSHEVREIVGVVTAVRLQSLRQQPIPLVFLPLAQPLTGWGAAEPALLIRAGSDLQRVRQAVRRELTAAGLSPEACDLRTLAERQAAMRVTEGLIARTVNGIGLVGLLFAATGIFGVMAYEVSRRTREIGIRMALGAQLGDVLKAILARGTLLALTGLGIGIGLSILPMQLLAGLVPEIRLGAELFLYGVQVWDPLTYALVTLGVVMVALAACWIPARRAAKVDPLVALRYE